MDWIDSDFVQSSWNNFSELIENQDFEMYNFDGSSGYQDPVMCDLNNLSDEKEKQAANVQPYFPDPLFTLQTSDTATRSPILKREMEPSSPNRPPTPPSSTTSPTFSTIDDFDSINTVNPSATMIDGTERKLKTKSLTPPPSPPSLPSANPLPPTTASTDRSKAKPTSTTTPKPPTKSSTTEHHSPPNTKPRQRRPRKRKAHNPEVEAERLDRTRARNRAAAHRCRERRKKQHGDLETRARETARERTRLQEQVNNLREELLDLKNVALEHAWCSAPNDNVSRYLKLRSDSVVMREAGRSDASSEISGGLVDESLRESGDEVEVR